MRKFLASSLLILLFTMALIGTLSAQAVLNGVVVDKESGQGINGVHIKLADTDITIVSNESGSFSIPGLEPGDYRILLSYVGYAPVEKRLRITRDAHYDISFELVSLIQSLEPVIIEESSITGGEFGVKELPGSAHYITPIQLRKFSYTDINQSLRQVPGVNLQEEDGFGLRPNIGLRGTGVERTSKITVMEDGILSAPAPYSAPSAYYFPTIGRMYAVEVVKGSSQIKYGPFTTGGAINLISTPVPDKFNAYMHFAGSSFNGKEFHAHAGNQHKYFSYMVETFQYGSDGFKNLDNGDDTGFDKKDYLFKFQLHNLASSVVQHKLQFKAGFSEEQSNETYLGLTASDFESDPYRRYSASQQDEMNTDHQQLSISYILKKSDRFSVTTTAYRNKFDRNWYKLDSFTDTAGTKTSISSALDEPSDEIYSLLSGTDENGNYQLNVKANNRSYTSQGVQSFAKLKFNTQNIEHGISAGIRFHYDEMDRFQWLDKYSMNDGFMMLSVAGVAGTESNRVHSADAIASHILYRMQYGIFGLSPGIRHEHIVMKKLDYGKSDPMRLGTDLVETKNSTSTFIPGVSIDALLNENYFVFAGVHKGFSPASATEDTKPEESVNYELGIRKNKGQLQGELVLFFNDYSNLLGSDFASSGGGGSGDQFNAGQAETMGVEFQINRQWLLNKGMSGSINAAIVYTYTNGTFNNSFESGFEGWEEVQKNDELPYMAKNQMTFFAGYKYKAFSFNASARYQDAMRTVAGQGAMQVNEQTDQQFLIDLGSEYHFHEYVSVFGSVNNLTGQEYVVARRPAGLRPGLPRFFKVGIRVNIN